MIRSSGIERQLQGLKIDDPDEEPSDAEVWRAIVAAGKLQGVYLPASYTKESPMNLAPPKFSDGTDRSLVRRWKALTGLGATSLERDLYYLTPYLTCERCNGLVFLDAARMRGFKVDGRDTALFPDETLVKCPGCASTVEYRIGAHDLLDQIAGSRAELARMLRSRHRAAAVLRRAYRFYLRRARGRAVRCEALVRGLLVARCGAVAASVVRGRLGRRKARTCRQVRVIQAAHPMSLARATRGDGDVWGNRRVPDWYKRELAGPTRRRRVFWYNSSRQVELLYHDYLELCARLGFLPPRFVVEANICEIARRIELREARLVTAVQARWRALTVQRLLLAFLRERVRWRQVRAAAVFRICRVVRGWMVRNDAVAARRAEIFRRNALGAYRRHRDAKRTKQTRDLMCDALRAAYVQERARERTARYCGLVHPSAAAGNKMRAFEISAYGSTTVADQATELTASIAADLKAQRSDKRAFDDRATVLKVRCDADSTLKTYHDAELRARSSRLIQQLSASHRVLSEKPAALLRHYNASINASSASVKGGRRPLAHV
ncbi:hypothetical protein CTAYLR_007838 [Chrysophaeum taylorii]|uniref:Uncharacterized protein n=1 Tax=Chrysophaeum taylorii TaxID=2483200 RepID=A0AAD7XH05_9STRA|nr:hypothetical protein CTAYLR_007838 [Chrysophaeum taylorii]